MRSKNNSCYPLIRILSPHPQFTLSSAFYPFIRLLFSPYPPSILNPNTFYTFCIKRRLRNLDHKYDTMAAFKTFKDISIFITGCNRGIGLTLVKQILSLPDSPKVIFGTCRSLKSDSSRELRGLAEKNPILHLLEFDVTNALQLENVVKQVETNLAGSGLNLLINNAGIYYGKPFQPKGGRV